jgi:hypothetical protein
LVSSFYASTTPAASVANVNVHSVRVNSDSGCYSLSDFHCQANVIYIYTNQYSSALTLAAVLPEPTGDVLAVRKFLTTYTTHPVGHITAHR